jgi:hypothetical protein
VRPSLFAAPAFAAARLALAQEPERERDEVEGALEFSAPYPEMRKASVLAGRWKGEQTWTDPLRSKRGRYEGYPGPEGHVAGRASSAR